MNFTCRFISFFIYYQFAYTQYMKLKKKRKTLNYLNSQNRMKQYQSIAEFVSFSFTSARIYGSQMLKINWKWLVKNVNMKEQMLSLTCL